MQMRRATRASDMPLQDAMQAKELSRRRQKLVRDLFNGPRVVASDTQTDGNCGVEMCLRFLGTPVHTLDAPERASEDRLSVLQCHREEVASAWRAMARNRYWQAVFAHFLRPLMETWPEMTAAASGSMPQGVPEVEPATADTARDGADAEPSTPPSKGQKPNPSFSPPKFNGPKSALLGLSQPQAGQVLLSKKRTRDGKPRSAEVTVTAESLLQQFLSTRRIHYRSWVKIHAAAAVKQAPRH